MPGGHIETFYTLGGGGLAMYPSAHTQGGIIHLGGGQSAPLPPSKETLFYCAL